MIEEDKGQRATSPNERVETEYLTGMSGSQQQARGWVCIFYPDREDRPAVYQELRGTWDEVLGQMHRIVHGEE